jgi:flagellar basal body-associated protein FliL
MNRNNLSSIVALIILAIVVVCAGCGMYNNFMSEKHDDLQEMADNHGECKSYGCVFRAHDHGYETKEEARWYHEHYPNRA